MDPEYVDTRSPQEKKSDWGGALMLAGGAVAYIAARRKLAITRGISRDILNAGLRKDNRYSKYVSRVSSGARPSPKLKSLRETIIDDTNRSREGFMNMVNDLIRSLPSDAESYAISIHHLNRSLGTPLEQFPAWKSFGLKESSLAQKIWHGPRVVPFAPGTSIGMVDRPDVPRFLGKHGGLLIDENLYPLLHPFKAEKEGSFYDPRAVIGGARVGLVNSWGSRLERQRRGLDIHIDPKNTEEYIRDVELDPRAVLDAERKVFIRQQYINRFFPGMGAGPGDDVHSLAEKLWLDRESEVVSSDPNAKPIWHNPHTGKLQPLPNLKQFMGHQVSNYNIAPKGSLTFEEKLVQDAEDTRAIIAKRASGSRFAQARFTAFKMGRKIGIGEEFASYGSGFPQSVERHVRSGAEWSYRHPVSGEAIRVTPRRYNVTGMTLGSNWKGSEGPWYITSRRDSLLRNLNFLSAGTMHRVLESATGIGVSSRPNVATEFMRKAVGAREGSWADMFIKNIGKTGRAMGIGLGAYYAYKAADSFTRSTVGFGPSDILSGTYVHAREAQQSLLSHLGVTHLARGLENSFPGSVSSPASYALRLLSPAILSHYLGRAYGPSGYAVGLAAGIAFAMITWGDITQSPEELHGIFTGEQEIPVRKGRYWLLGNTPFFGGKISYWRPHWYPLMKSHREEVRQEWGSERMYWAEGTPFSPVLAPLLTGHLWDPYYFERRHYHDRPYPITGELFEPTMPFSALANATIGRIIKPPILMHTGYLGTEQTDSSQEINGLSPNIGPQLGFNAMPQSGITSGESPYSAKYQLGLAAYSQTEQMGILGYLTSTLWKKITGQQDFMSSQSVLQSSRRATGYERGYWQRDFGDPGAGLEEGLTEYFRRFLPHRRSNADEYNPIPNKAPSWLPGSDYFINFQQGDPYVKIPYGEQRLPGPVYESLHMLHSQNHGVYDVVDRFMVLANVAPYSDEYREYKRMVLEATSNDPKWSKKVQQAISQRDALSQEYQFLDMSTDKVPALLRPASSIYRHVLSGIEELPNPMSINPMSIVSGIVPVHINKWISNKTPESAYRDFRLYGSEFQPWDQPWQSFATPIIDSARGKVNPGHVPVAVQHQREVEEYFDKLKYIKYTNLAAIARYQGNSELASKLSRVARYTMSAENYNPAVAMASIPPEERSFYNAFSQAEGTRRQRILEIVPPYMRPYYMEAWNMNDGKETYNVNHNVAKQMTAYFNNHYLPPPDWQGWHPDVDLNKVKLRVVKDDAFDIHKFNLWENEERELSRQPFVPTIKDINAHPDDLTMLHNAIMDNMNRLGMTDSKVYITRTPSSESSHKINIKINRDNSKKEHGAMNSTLYSISG